MNKEIVSGLDPSRLPDLILVNSPLRDYEERKKDDYEVLPPLGLAYIATQASSESHNVGLIDAEHHGVEQSILAETVNNLQPRFAGINVLTPNRIQALKFAKQLDPEIPLIIGGAHANAMIERTLREFTIVHPKVILARGEAELAVSAILGGRNPHTMPGIFWLEETRLRYTPGLLLPDNLDALPTLDRRFLANDPSVDSHTGRTEARILSSRGCPFNCSFCVGARDSSGVKVRNRSAVNVASEISGLVIDNHCQSIRFVDDLFISSEKRARSVLNAMENARIPHTYWDATGRANIFARFSSDFFNYLKAHGAYEVALGVESASERLRKRVNKQASMEEIQRSIRELTQRGIRVKGYFIIGLPTEIREETISTINLAKQLTQNHPDKFRGSIFIFRPYPGTKEWSWLIEKGYQEDDLLNMHAEGTGERAKHDISPSQQFGECNPSELAEILAEYNRWQTEFLQDYFLNNNK